METRYVVTYIDRNNGSLEAYHLLVPAETPEGAAELVLATHSWAQVVDVSDVDELRGILVALEAQSGDEIFEALVEEERDRLELRALLAVAEEAGAQTVAHGLRLCLQPAPAPGAPTPKETP